MSNKSRDKRRGGGGRQGGSRPRMSPVVRKLTAAQREQYKIVSELKPEWSEQEALELLDKCLFDPDTVQDALHHAFEDERHSGAEEWTTVKSNKTKRKEKNEDNSKGKGSRDRGSRGTGSDSRRGGGRGRGRGARRGRGRGGGRERSQRGGSRGGGRGRNSRNLNYDAQPKKSENKENVHGQPAKPSVPSWPGKHLADQRKAQLEAQKQAAVAAQQAQAATANAAGASKAPSSAADAGAVQENAASSVPSTEAAGRDVQGAGGARGRQGGRGRGNRGRGSRGRPRGRGRGTRGGGRRGQQNEQGQKGVKRDENIVNSNAPTASDEIVTSNSASSNVKPQQGQDPIGTRSPLRKPVAPSQQPPTKELSGPVWRPKKTQPAKEPAAQQDSQVANATAAYSAAAGGSGANPTATNNATAPTNQAVSGLYAENDPVILPGQQRSDFSGSRFNTGAPAPSASQQSKPQPSTGSNTSPFARMTGPGGVISRFGDVKLEQQQQQQQPQQPQQQQQPQQPQQPPQQSNDNTAKSAQDQGQSAPKGPTQGRRQPQTGKPQQPPSGYAPPTGGPQQNYPLEYFDQRVNASQQQQQQQQPQQPQQQQFNNYGGQFMPNMQQQFGGQMPYEASDPNSQLQYYEHGQAPYMNQQGGGPSSYRKQKKSRGQRQHPLHKKNSGNGSSNVMDPPQGPNAHPVNGNNNSNNNSSNGPNNNGNNKGSRGRQQRQQFPKQQGNKPGFHNSQGFNKKGSYPQQPQANFTQQHGYPAHAPGPMNYNMYGYAPYMYYQPRQFPPGFNGYGYSAPAPNAPYGNFPQPFGGHSSPTGFDESAQGQVYDYPKSGYQQPQQAPQPAQAPSNPQQLAQSQGQPNAHQPLQRAYFESWKGMNDTNKSGDKPDSTSGPPTQGPPPQQQQQQQQQQPQQGQGRGPSGLDNVADPSGFDDRYSHHPNGSAPFGFPSFRPPQGQPQQSAQTHMGYGQPQEWNT